MSTARVATRRARDGRLANSTRAAPRNTLHYGANGGQTSRQTWVRGKFRDLAFHFWRRVDWWHILSSYSELFRYAGQVRTTVSE